MADADMQQPLEGEPYDPTLAGTYNDADFDDDEEDQQLQDEEDDDDDYDPSNMQFQEAHTSAQPVTEGANGGSGASNQQAVATTKQRTVGGFIEDDDDDDEDGAMPSVSVAGQENATPRSMGAGRSVTQTPVNIIHNATPDISIQKAATAAHTAQDMGSSGVTVPSTNMNNSAPPTNGALGSATTAAASGLTPSQTPLPHSVVASSSSTVPLPKARLPQDRVGIFGDRIAADPRGDTDAWLSLIEEYKQRNNIEEVYETYERFLKLFPQAGDQWAAYIQTMMQNEDTKKAETAFGKVLLQVPHVRCWSLYIDYIRRMNNLATDQSGQARNTINSAFEFTLKHVGQDPHALQLWQDYINFVKSMPGNISGEGWQDKQKVDACRKAYRQALSIPLPNLLQLWGEYTNFEITASRVNGRKFQNEQMPNYMTAKQAYIALENKIQYLNRSTVPKLPPLPGFDGYEEYQTQVKIWRDWIEWEKEDPLVLKDDKADGSALKNRVLFVYKIALMTLRFDPHMWYDAVQYCFDNDLKDEGEKLLTQAIEANPESCLLAFTKADRIETQTVGDNDPVSRGMTARQPYNKLIDALYDLFKQTKERSEREIAEVQERFAQEAREDQQEREKSQGSDDEGMDNDNANAKETAERREAEIKLVQEKYDVQLHELRRLITSAWVALIRAMRRIQGKGKPNSSELPGSRGILSETRKRGNITSELYIQCALTEWYCYKDPAALRLFDKGMTLYPTDENFALEYIKHLISQSDLTNARTVFEKAVSRLEKEPGMLHKAKPLYYYFHNFESKYGELAQIQKLEQRIRDMFPEDPTLQVFAHRFEYESALQRKFDPTAVQPIVSPNTQLRPAIMPSIEQGIQPTYPTTATGIPQITVGGTNSPKRPFLADGAALDGPPRKVARGESPLKGAAGRRIANTRQAGAAGAGGSNTPLIQASAPPSNWPVPQHINFLLSVLPNARYASTVTPPLDAVGLVNVMRGVNLQQPGVWAAANLKTAGRGLMDPVYLNQGAPPIPMPPATTRPTSQHLQQAPLPNMAWNPPPPLPMGMSVPPPQQGYYPPPSAVGQQGGAPGGGYVYGTPVNGMYGPFYLPY